MSTIDTFRDDAVLKSGTRTDAANSKGRLLAIIVWVEAVLARRRSRLALLEMTDDQLKDIGISRSQAYREGLRPFWQ